jgi:plastocyanin
MDMHEGEIRRAARVSFPTTLMAIGLAMLLGIGLYARSSASATPTKPSSQAAPAAAATNYTPQTRGFVMTIVPGWVHEQTGVFDYLDADFSKKGLLNEKEVWNFSPSSITVYQGDTVVIDLYNPSSDPHTWTLMGMDVNVPVGAQAMAPVRFVATKVGLFTFNCEIGEHFPFMTGQLVVLPATVAPQS